MKKQAKAKGGKRPASDKICSVSSARTVHAVLIISPALRHRILALFDDGFTLHEISEAMPGIHCVGIAQVICEEIGKDAEQCT